jgi:4-amino-4-deoxy-L-arabinose transferase-like glycosyltransferase
MGNSSARPRSRHSNAGANATLSLPQLRRHLGALAPALLLATALRLAWIAWIHPDPSSGQRFDDTAWYRAAAHYFANGDGYVNPFTGTPTAAWPPGYPVFLGITFSSFGEGVAQTTLANLALAVATVALVYTIGCLAFDRRIALVAAFALALWPGQIYFTSLTLSEPLFTFLFTLAALLMLAAARVDRGRAAVIVAFGAVTGLAVLTRGQAAILLPVFIIMWMMRDRWQGAIGWGILAAFVMAAVMAPWVLRNEQKLGSPVIVATNMGPNLWIGHHEGASGRMHIDAPEPPQPGNRDELTQPRLEVEADRLALRLGVEYMLTHPLDELRLSTIKLRAMYESDATALDWNSGYSDGYYGADGIEFALRRLANGFWFAALALAAAGLVASRHALRGPAGLLALTVLAWTATHLLFFGDPRFHYPIVFAIALLAARGAVTVAEALRRPSVEREYAPA